jgi:DNA-binding NarL/FixJ family response regulator
LKYRNAKTVLPDRLFKELQQYVQGEIIYIPRDDSVRAGWGEKNGTREKYINRNKEIIKLYKNGVSKEVIADKFYLSEYSIKKIINDNKLKCSSNKR